MASDKPIPIIAPTPTNSFDIRRQSIAKLSTTPSSYSHLSNTLQQFRDNNNSINNSTNNRNSNSSVDLLANNSNTPNSRKLFSFNLTPPKNRSNSPVLIESDDDNNSLISPNSFGSYVDDSTIIKNVSKHLPTDHSNSLKLASGDMTRDLYHINNNQIRRSKSFSENDRRGSTASQLRLPGGFRRDFITNQKYKYGYTLTKPTTFLTKNFLEFLTIYGHFAGENLEDEDFLACDYDTSSDKIDQESPLLRSSQQANIDDNNLENQKKTSSIKAFFLLVKAFIGTGVLFLPKAFSNGGLIFSIILLFLFSILSYYCYLVLSQSTIKTGITSFAELGNSLYGKTFKYLILISIILSQIGFVAAYTVFTAENLKAFVKNTINVNFPLYYYVIFETIFFIPMSLIRNITKLSLAALLANIFILSGIITIVFYTSKDLIVNGPSKINNFNSDNWSLFIGVAIFAFEGIGLIIPVQQSMKHPEDFPKVLLAVIVVCCCLFITIGWLCYLTYGENVKTVVILNLPQDAIPVISIQFFYALAIMLSVPLQLLPAIRLMESRIFKRNNSSGKNNLKIKWSKNFFRLLITLLTSTVAYLGSSNLDLFVSFVGCFACIPLVYMYPPMIHLKAVANTKFSRSLDILLVVLGGAAMVFTTIQLFI